MENISLSQAWAHVAQSPGYWIWLILAAIVCGAVIFKLVKNYQNGDMDGRQITFFGIIMIAVFTFALLFRPCEVAANTTKDQATRGVYIGY